MKRIHLALLCVLAVTIFSSISSAQRPVRQRAHAAPAGKIAVAKADIISFPPAGIPGGYWVNFTKFSDYPTISQPPGWVDLGNCGPLNFGARFEIPGTFSKHTFTVWLKKDGATIATESTKVGPLTGTKLVELNFPQVGFSPGEWKIEWQFLTSPQHTDSASIKLIAPILKSLTPPYEGTYGTDYNQIYCGAQPYSNNLCVYRPKPPTGFIYNNSYYRAATNMTSTCPVGIPYDVVCLIATAPQPGFVHNNSLYFRPNGLSGFVIALNRPPFTGGSCPANLGSYPVTKDSWGCLVMPAPYWQNAVVRGQGLYLTRRYAGTCIEGSFDGANCQIRTPPSGSTALEIAGTWYWTPRYCN